MLDRFVRILTKGADQRIIRDIQRNRDNWGDVPVKFDVEPQFLRRISRYLKPFERPGDEEGFVAVLRTRLDKTFFEDHPFEMTANEINKLGDMVLRADIMLPNPDLVEAFKEVRGEYTTSSDGLGYIKWHDFGERTW